MEQIDNFNLYAINEIERKYKVAVIARVGIITTFFTISFPNNDRLNVSFDVYDILGTGPLEVVNKLEKEIINHWNSKIRRV